MRIGHLLGCCSLVMAMTTVSASAATFLEGIDTGDQLATAHLLPGGTTQIIGTISSGENDIDLFRFAWGGGDFAANTVPEPDLQGQTMHDPMLWLFDAFGRGIQGDDDSAINNFALDAALLVTNLLPGTYYIGISAFEVEPFNGNNPIFPLGPSMDGPIDADATLQSWVVLFPNTAFGGGYIVNLSETATLAQVPEPGALALMLGGLLGWHLLRRA
jgi:hypothetical protein